MIDQKIYTFLTLCDFMNYRKTAEVLQMTQPAVTQHIQALEQLYQCKLFLYQGRVLSKTPQALQLEQHARTMVYNEQHFHTQMLHKPQQQQNINIGATKTIGDYLMQDLVFSLLQNEQIALNLVIDNTQRLFEQLHNCTIDFAMIEGYFDKTSYDYMPICSQELVGICAPEHPFANKKVPLASVLAEHLIVREQGSGTRDVLAHFLQAENLSFEAFHRISTLSSFVLIQRVVSQNCGISFVYRAIADQNPAVATFRIDGRNIAHTLYYVYLKNTNARATIEALEKSTHQSECF